MIKPEPTNAKLTPPSLNNSNNNNNAATPPNIQLPSALNPYLNGNGHQYANHHPYSHAFAYYNNMNLTPASATHQYNPHLHYNNINHSHHGNSYSDSPSSSSSPTSSSSSSAPPSATTPTAATPASNHSASNSMGKKCEPVVGLENNVGSTPHYMANLSTPVYNNNGPKPTHNPNVKVKLMDMSLWNKFNQIGTEMIITKCGRYIIARL